jgi:protein ImuB
VRPARLLSEPASLEAELDAQGALKGARLLGRRRKVVAMVGPERLTGGWWERAAFGRDYYRVFFEGLGPAWVFKNLDDGRYYLQGLFD